MAAALTLLGGVLGMIAGVLAPTQETPRWVHYVTPPPAQRLLSFNGNALYLLGANGRIYACVDQTRQCQMVARPAAHDVDVGCWGLYGATPPASARRSPAPVPDPPAPTGTRSLIYVSWCGVEDGGTEFFGLLDNGQVWRLSQYSVYDPERPLSNGLESAGLGAAGGFGLAILLALGLEVTSWRRPVAAVPPPPVESPPGDEPPPVES
ncbi:MAG TPA: hypothetical protein VGE07_18070 [Herpetosiphonaceae bacterium]